jgi:DNA-binding response OmpR family regulator
MPLSTSAATRPSPPTEAPTPPDPADAVDPVDPGEPSGTVIVVGGLLVDRGAGVARLDGRPLPLRRREFELLAYLAERSGRFVSRQELMRQVWHDPILASGNTLHVHLSSLRRKLGERPDAPRYVHTRRNQGICVTVPGDHDG